MRISLTLLFLVVLQLSAENSYAQRMRIAISMSNVSVEQVLNKIEETSDYVFLYNDETIQKSRIVSVRSKSGKITDILDDIFKGTDISYTVIDKQIILSKSNKVNQTAKAIQIKGTVKDALGEPLIGVSVLVKGTSNGTVTDLDGRFSLNVSVGDILEFSYVGYAAQSVTVKNATPLDIVLSEDAQALDEVVVTALGIKREAKALTYNVQEIKAAGITKVKDANFVNSLSGKIAGVTINQSSSGTGGSSRVVMRGTKSLFGENNALYVLDGIPMQGLRTKQSDNFYESVEVADGDGISNINPEDIESMSVLTGASAAALYGNRGANGVILITTKKGAIGKPRISYSNSTSFSRPFVTPEFQNTYGRKEGEFKSWGDKLEKPSTYNPLDFFQTGFNTMNSIAVSTGTETNQTHISFGAVNSEGIIDNNKYNRYNFTFRNSWDIVKNVLSMDMGLFYIKQNNQNSNGQGMYYNPLVPIYLFPPSDDINKYAVYERYDADRNFKTQYWPYGNQGLGMQNPYWIINRNMFNTDRDRYIISLSMKWNITNWLNIIGRARIDNAYTDFERKLYASTDGLFAKSQGNLSNTAEYFKVDFRKESKYNTAALPNVTFEARVRFKKMTPTSRKWCFSVMGLEENFCLRTAGSNTEGWKLQLSGGSPAIDSRDVLPNDKWVHLACVYDGSQGKKFIYVNGELQGELPDTRGTVDLTYAYGQDANAAFYIGQSAADDRYMNGYVSEARVWAVARSAADLKNNVCWVDPLTDGLVAYWRFNEPAEDNAKVVTDLTGNGYNATFAGWGNLRFVEGVRCPDNTAE